MTTPSQPPSYEDSIKAPMESIDNQRATFLRWQSRGASAEEVIEWAKGHEDTAGGTTLHNQEEGHPINRWMEKGASAKEVNEYVKGQRLREKDSRKQGRNTYQSEYYSSTEYREAQRTWVTHAQGPLRSSGQAARDQGTPWQPPSQQGRGHAR